MSAVPTVVAVAKTSVEEAVPVQRTIPLLSATRVPICLVATLVSLTQGACWLHSGIQRDSELQQHDCVRWVSPSLPRAARCLTLSCPLCTCTAASISTPFLGCL